MTNTVLKESKKLKSKMVTACYHKCPGCGCDLFKYKGGKPRSGFIVTEESVSELTLTDGKISCVVCGWINTNYELNSTGLICRREREYDKTEDEEN